jgi:nucleotide-binding universal stress UspA family protein
MPRYRRLMARTEQAARHVDGQASRLRLPRMHATESNHTGPSGRAGAGPVQTVLLATDLSPTSGPATDEAFAIAGRNRAELLVVSVIDPTTLRLPGGRFGARVDQLRERREPVAQHLVERGRRDGVHVRFLIWEGDPAESILDAANAESADIVVLGSHGRGPVGRLLLGSVSQHVVRHARVPVVVVSARLERHA